MKEEVDVSLAVDHVKMNKMMMTVTIRKSQAQRVKKKKTTKLQVMRKMKTYLQKSATVKSNFSKN